MTAEQLSLEFPTRNAVGVDDFFVAPTNEMALQWIDRWPNWPGGILLIVGPAASGKTHLSYVWQELAGAKRIDSSSLGQYSLAELAKLSAANLVIENLDRGFDEQVLFHLYNLRHEHGGSILMTARSPARDWNLSLKDLISRLGTVPVVTIKEPDDDLFAAVLLKMFSDKQLRPAPEVLNFILLRAERSFATAQEIVNLLDRKALQDQRKITIPMVKSVL